MIQSLTPLYVQFEVTYQCNNRCIFCYNDCDGRNVPSLNTKEAKRIVSNLAVSGILGVNFNGGEPLAREDFFEVAAYAKELGLDIHLNTNATLVRDEVVAQKVAGLFPSVCVSVLSSDPLVHDRLSGRKDSFRETLHGLRLLHMENVYVAVNVMLCNDNAATFTDTLKLLNTLETQTVLVTRFVPCGHNNKNLHIDDALFFDCVRQLAVFQEERHCFARISLPQPIPLCRVPDDLKECVRHWNIPCNIGLCTASVSCEGTLTPCNLVKTPALGNLLTQDFSSIWEAFDGASFCEKQHLLPECLSCGELANCGGGCKGYNNGVKANREECS